MLLVSVVTLLHILMLNRIHIVDIHKEVTNNCHTHQICDLVTCMKIKIIQEINSGVLLEGEVQCE